MVGSTVAFRAREMASKLISICRIVDNAVDILRRAVSQLRDDARTSKELPEPSTHERLSAAQKGLPSTTPAQHTLS